MVRYKWVGKWDDKQKKRMIRLWQFVKTRPCKDLLIKFVNCQPYRYHYRGHFKFLFFSWFPSENKYRERGIMRIITLKFKPDKLIDEEIVKLIAHEYRHYLQSRNDTRIGKKLKGKPSERDAKKYADKIVRKFGLIGG